MANGPLEIYGVVIGVKMFDAMFNILASMGIIFIPLLIMFFQNITTPFESEIENGAATSLRRVFIQLLIWIFTVMLLVAPTWKLNVKAISYRPVCAPTAVLSTIGDTGTTYDDVFKNLKYDNLRIPIMLGVVLGGMSGFTNALITSLPCKTDVQEMKNIIDTTRLTRAISIQAERFKNECYAPAIANFDNQTPDFSSYKDTLNKYGGETDLSWIGSHTLGELYYDNIYPQRPVVGFPSASYPYIYQEYNTKHGVGPDKWGFPTCTQWWSDPLHGLQHQLVNLVEKHSPNNPHLGVLSFVDRMSAVLTHVKRFIHLGSQVTTEDVISRDLLYDPNNNSGFGQSYTGQLHIINDVSMNKSIYAVSAAIAHGISAVGQGVSAVGSIMDRAEISQEIPILQATLLAFVLCLGPMIILIALMTPRAIGAIFTYYFLVGSIVFMTFIEKFIHYIELSLHASQSYSVYAIGNVLIMYNLFTKLYFYAPLLYLMLMSIAGAGIGSSLERAFRDKSYGAGKNLAKNVLKVGL